MFKRRYNEREFIHLLKQRDEGIAELHRKLHVFKKRNQRLHSKVQHSTEMSNNESLLMEQHDLSVVSENLNKI